VRQGRRGFVLPCGFIVSLGLEEWGDERQMSGELATLSLQLTPSLGTIFPSLKGQANSATPGLSFNFLGGFAIWSNAFWLTPYPS
jgi:hypothetical protein